MKQTTLLLLTGIAVTLSSCKQDAVMGPEVGRALSFSASENGAFTRSTPITSKDRLPNIVVYGYYPGNGADNWESKGATAAPTFINGEVVTNANAATGDPASWSYPNTVYWPTPADANVTFFAYSPVATSDNGIVVANTTGTPTMTYTVPTDVTMQPDLMVAVPHKDINRVNNGSSTVSFSMKHALTCVGFSVAGQGDVVTGIKISGVSMTGTLSMDGTTVAWSGKGAPTSTEFSAGVNTTTTTAEMTNLMQGNGYLMMIPQRLGAGAKITVSFEGRDDVEIVLSGKAWSPGQRIRYQITITPESTVTVTPEELILPPAGIDAANGNLSVLCQDGSGNEAPAVTWTIASSASSWLRLSLSPTATFATATESVSSRGSQTVYTYADQNSSASSRTTTVTLGSSTVNVTQLSPAVIPPGGSGTEITSGQTYVGAFWKSDQTGERIIRIPVTSASNAGTWMATVYQTDASWSADDIVFDNNMDDAFPMNNNNAEGYQVASSSTAARHASGLITSGASSASPQYILFRIGLKSTHNATAATPARYATVVITYANGAKAQLLFLRQGHDPDYLMGSGSSPKWSPYNVGTAGSFVDYPTKAGYYKKWTTSTTMYDPSIAGVISDWTNDVTNTGIANVCPLGYKIPSTDGSSAPSASNEMGYLQAASSAYGYYADGYFDRRAITGASGTNASSNSTVSNGTADVAYIGSVFYNPATMASLFLPAAGFRRSIGGRLDYAGYIGYYWSGSLYSSFFSWYFSFSNSSLYQRYSDYNFGFSIRSISQ